MGLLQALGINGLAIIQFGILLVIFLFLSLYVFGPYLRAAEERQTRTKGGEALADEYQQKTTDLQIRYQERAREIHGQIAALFQQSRSEAATEYERIVGKAREESNRLIEKNRLTIGEAVSVASADLRREATQASLAITNKLLGK